ncbi:MAG: response regulator [Verrucomicrobiota bacterium]
MRPVKPVVLHVDDDEDDRILFRQALQLLHSNLVVRSLPDAEDARDFLLGAGAYANRDAAEFPDIMLLDIRMPGMTGLDLLRWMRSSDGILRRLPVVILTSSDLEADLVSAYELGANSYVVKPSEFKNWQNLAVMLENYWFFWNRHPRKS